MAATFPSLTTVPALGALVPRQLAPTMSAGCASQCSVISDINGHCQGNSNNLANCDWNGVCTVSAEFEGVWVNFLQP